MNITVTGRHMEVKDQLRDFIEQKVSKLSRIYPALIEANIILEQDRYEFVTEISLHAKPFDLFGKSHHTDVKQSISLAVRKVERQMIKHKERLQEHKVRTQEHIPETDSDDSEEGD